MTSDKQKAALQEAVERGQRAFRNGEPREANPYPPQSPYFDQWDQGWIIESEINDK